MTTETRQSALATIVLRLDTALFEWLRGTILREPDLTDDERMLIIEQLVAMQLARVATTGPPDDAAYSEIVLGRILDEARALVTGKLSPLTATPRVMH